MAKKEKSTGLTVYDGNKYAIIQGNVDDMRDILAANIGGEGIDEFQLDRVGMPSGGGIAWMVPDLNGEPESVNELVGVVLLHGDRRVYWKASFEESGGGGPPDCSSMNGRTGIGYIKNDEPSPSNPPKTRACKACPMSQWGSGANANNEKSNSQACSARKILYLIREGDILPLVIDLAPTSIGVFSKFMLRLTSRRVPCYGAIVGLKLRQEKSEGGIKYSVVAPRLISLLSPEDSADMQKAADALRPFFEKTEIVPPIEHVRPTVNREVVDTATTVQSGEVIGPDDDETMSDPE